MNPIIKEMNNKQGTGGHGGRKREGRYYLELEAEVILWHPDVKLHEASSFGKLDLCILTNTPVYFSTEIKYISIESTNQ